MQLNRIICLLLVLGTILVYLPVHRHQFIVYDDPQYVVENRIVQAGITLSGIKWAFSTFHASNWHPVTWLSHMLDAELFGTAPGPHHVINMLFHAANAALVFIVLMHLSNRPWPAAVVAALFALHPLRVESVAWIAERKDVLSAFLGLLTLLFYARFAVRSASFEQNSLGTKRAVLQSGGRGCSGHYLAALAVYTLGLMSKPMLVSLPTVMLLLDYWPLERFGSVRSNQMTGTSHSALRTGRTLPIQALILEKVPFFLLACATSIVTLLAQHAEAVVAFEVYPLWRRIANAVVAYGTYLAKTFLPLNLAVIYPLPKQIVWWHMFGAGAVLVCVSWFAWRMRRQRPYLVVGWLWFVVMLLPVIGLVQVGGQAMADRYTYLPLIGVFIMLSYGCAELVLWLHVNRWICRVGAATVLALCAVATRHQLQFWHDSESLFKHAIAVTTDNELAHVNLGTWLQEQGRLAEALDHYRAALQIQPARPHTHNNIATVLDLLGQDEAAEKHYKLALQLRPNAPLAHLNYGSFLLKRGRVAEAIEHYAMAQQLAPEDPRPPLLLGKATLQLRRATEAEQHFRRALQLDKDNIQALTLLARLLACDKRTGADHAGEAVAFAEHANALVGGQNPFVLDTLACAYAAAGRFAEAQQTILTAINIAIATGATNALAEMQHRLELFRAGQSCGGVIADQLLRW